VILKPQFLLEAYAAIPEKVGPMKPLQGPTPVGQNETDLSLIGSMTSPKTFFVGNKNWGRALNH
jgi:hypothetical protein